MRARQLAGAILFATGVAVSSVTPAHAATIVGQWNMNETSGSVMHDSSGYNNDGNIPTSVNIDQPGYEGRSYFFTGGGPVRVPSDASLNPGGQNITYSVRVKMTATQAAGEANLLQKGLVGGSGGQYKLEINDGVPACYARESDAAGGQSLTVTSSGGSVANNSWHKLTCLVSGTSLTLYVDGTATGSKSASSIGSIANINPLTLGGKEKCSTTLGCDYYTGYMDTAFVSIG